VKLLVAKGRFLVVALGLAAAAIGVTASRADAYAILDKLTFFGPQAALPGYFSECAKATVEVQGPDTSQRYVAWTHAYIKLPGEVCNTANNRPAGWLTVDATNVFSILGVSCPSVARSNPNSTSPPIYSLVGATGTCGAAVGTVRTSHWYYFNGSWRLTVCNWSVPEPKPHCP
jgi:hypothetical protein